MLKRQYALMTVMARNEMQMKPELIPQEIVLLASIDT